MSEMQLRHTERLPFSQCWRAAGLSLLLALFCLGGGVAAPPARAAGSSIEIPAEIKVAPAVVTRLKIKIALAEGAGPQAILLVRGLPARVMLSEGRLFSAGVWAVPLTSIGKLEIAPATGTSGSSELSFQVISLDGQVLADAKSTLLIEPQAAADGRQDREDAAKGKSILLTTGALDGTGAQGGDKAKQAPTAPVSLDPETEEKARKMMERGDESMAEGKITSARLFYKAAAEIGWAPAAFALAKTYDANELSHSTVVGGVRPDPALAQKWYQKASELGSAEASHRLQALQTR
jgi:hypothetical protein